MAVPLPPMDLSDNPTGCCPRFHPEGWDHADFTLEGLKFIKVSTKSFLHIPLDMGKVMSRVQKEVDAAGARPKDRYFMLSKDLSSWKTEHYILVAKDVPGYQTESLPGTFHSAVFEGPYSQTGTWYRAMSQEMAGLGKTAKDIYAFYTTCPGCAKTYGKNYVVLMAQTAA